MRFSWSYLRKRLTCANQARLEYEVGLEALQPRAVYGPGKFTHALLEEGLKLHARGDITLLEVTLTDSVCALIYQRLAKEEYLDLTETEVRACAVAARESLKWLELDQWETLVLPDGRPAVELEIEVPWRGHTLISHIDWVARSKRTGKTWIIDHKTTRGSLDNPVDDGGEELLRLPEFVETDGQLILYQEAARVMGIETDGAMLHMVRIPKRIEPATLKSGSVSRDKRKASMPWSCFERALLERKLDPDHYADLREHMQARRWNMWRPLVTTDEARSRLLDSFELLLNTPLARTYSKVPGICDRGCDVRVACDYEMNGGDLRDLIGVAYGTRSRSPLKGEATFNDTALRDHFNRRSKLGRFDQTGFVP